jgi:hypothetical protein
MMADTLPTPVTNALGMMAASPALGNGQNRGDSNWFEALSQAWGQSLDSEANRIQTMSDAIGDNGADNPSAVVNLTTEAERMSFMANSSSTSIDSVGKALQTMASKNG